MKMRIFQQLDPRENRLPADTSRFIRQQKPRHLPLVNPDRFIQNNPAIQRMIAKSDPVNPETIRMETRERIQRMADEANRMISESIQFKRIEFGVDEDSGRFVAVVRDRQTGQTLKQIPSEQMLNMAARLQQASGLFTDIEI